MIYLKRTVTPLNHTNTLLKDAFYPMSFHRYTNKYALLLRVVLTTAYLFVLVAGLAALFNPPVTISGALTVTVTRFWGLLALLGGLGGAWGAVTDKWRLEFMAAPLASAGVMCYAIGVWTVALSDPGRSAQGGVVMATSLLLLFRTVELFATADYHRGLRGRGKVTPAEVVEATKLNDSSKGA